MFFFRFQIPNLPTKRQAIQSIIIPPWSFDHQVSLPTVPAETPQRLFPTNPEIPHFLGKVARFSVMRAARTLDTDLNESEIEDEQAGPGQQKQPIEENDSDDAQNHGGHNQGQKADQLFHAEMTVGTPADLTTGAILVPARTQRLSGIRKHIAHRFSIFNR